MIYKVKNIKNYMINKIKISMIFMLILSSLLINFVSANMLVSDSGVRYESRILEEFDKLKMNETVNETFIKVIIYLKNISEVNDLISNFSERELRNIINRQIPNKSSERIGAEVTEEGFYKLIQDDRIDKIYYNFPVYPTEKSSFELRWLLLLLIIIILVIIFYIFLKNKKR